MLLDSTTTEKNGMNSTMGWWRLWSLWRWLEHWHCWCMLDSRGSERWMRRDEGQMVKGSSRQYLYHLQLRRMQLPFRQCNRQRQINRGNNHRRSPQEVDSFLSQAIRSSTTGQWEG